MDQSKFNISQRKYFGKLLLFGEYGIILNSMGLAIPFRKFSGGFKFAEDKSKQKKESNEILNCLGDFAKEKQVGKFNESLFINDISNKIYFESDIPHGYGAGSSGALVAAFYERYFELRKNKDQIKIELGALEDFFHGKSSGYDPLVSFLNNPILINENKTFEELRNIEFRGSDVQVFLIDTGFARQTKGFVNSFMKDLDNRNYRQQFEEKYIEPSNRAIKTLLQNDNDSFFKSVKEISTYQFDNWKSLIPKNIISLYKDSLQSDDFTLKLCGAGGGGYFLGFTRNMDDVKKQFDQNNIRILLV